MTLSTRVAPVPILALRGSPRRGLEQAQGGAPDGLESHRQHIINLYVWPATDGDELPSSHAQDGYSLVHWCRDRMEYWAVSDLNQEDLRHFAELQITAVTGKALMTPNT